MKLTVLVDNNTYIDRYYLGEPAFCCFLEDGDRRILLDTGYSDIFLSNAEKLGIDLSAVTDIVLSHAHNDHTGGLAAFFRAFPQARPRLTAHPEVFSPRMHDGLSIGAPLSREEAAAHTVMTLTEKPVQISEHVLYLGEIPRRTEFETFTVGTRLTADGWLEDALPDDTALALETEHGVFLLPGCSHSGICNIILRAKELFPDQPICGLMGGLHLFDWDERAKKTGIFLEHEQIPALYPCHCTSFAVRAMLSRTLPLTEVGVGLQLEL